MNFASDNWSGASEPVIAALAEAARKGGPAYGADELTKAVERRFAELFEREVAVFLVASGTAANALALANYAKPGGVVFCHREAHPIVDEAGAAALFGGGTVLRGIDGVDGKLTPDALAAALAEVPEGFIHAGQPSALSLAQLTEQGTVYAPTEVAALADVARSRGAAVHMDGARFAGAIAALGAAPAEVTWKAGVDVLSFGGTKNGCLAAETVIFFKPADAKQFPFIRQRAGQGFSKNWFIAAQLDAYLGDGHWLKLAGHANAMGARLAQAIRESKTTRLAIEPAANEVFAVIPKAMEARLKAAGAVFYPWPDHSVAADRKPGKGEMLVRLVTSWQTTEGEVDAFATVLNAG